RILSFPLSFSIAALDPLVPPICPFPSCGHGDWGWGRGAAAVGEPTTTGRAWPAAALGQGELDTRRRWAKMATTSSTWLGKPGSLRRLAAAGQSRWSAPKDERRHRSPAATMMAGTTGGGQ
ncbi:unnamed protein product, partial [Urochloa humidicola]